MQIDQIEKIDYLKTTLTMSVLDKFIPYHLIENFKKNNPKQFRERIYSLDVALQGMLYQAISDDKSDQNAVFFISKQFKIQRESYLKKESEDQEKLQLEKKKRGRPRKTINKIQQSKLAPVSVNTASYSEAKQRFPLELMEEIAENIKNIPKKVNLWHGHRVYIVDGTTLDTPDYKELREHFMPDGVQPNASLPIVKMEGLIDLFGGMLIDVFIDNFRSSEGKMFKVLYRSIFPGTIILGDDLYSSYSHMWYCRSKRCDMIARGKHKRNDILIRKIDSNDSIVQWRIYKRPAWFSEEDNFPKTMEVRRIKYQHPITNNDIYIYTTLIDEIKYPAVDIIALFVSRWDIEICFKDIKKTMKMEHLRSKSIDMIYKEIYSYLIVYNIIRLIMYIAYYENDTGFFSLRKAVQKSFTDYQNHYYNLDKLGRSYSRKSHGRYDRNNKKENQKQKSREN